MSGYPRTPERSIPRSTEKRREKQAMSGGTECGAREARAMQNRAEGERQRQGHLKARCRDQAER